MVRIAQTPLMVVGVEPAIMVGLLLGLWFGWQELQQLRQQVSEAQRTVENIPQQLLEQDDIASELKKQATRLQQLEKFLPRREAIGEVVAAIESLARQNGVSVIVPDVKEEIRYGRDNKPIPVTGRYLDVRLIVQGYGDPTKLMTFLYGMEHLPYLLRIPDWKISTDFLVVPAALSVSPPEGTASPERPAGLLEAGVVLTITRDPL